VVIQVLGQQAAVYVVGFVGEGFAVREYVTAWYAHYANVASIACGSANGYP
jgi:hypothetical protein